MVKVKCEICDVKIKSEKFSGHLNSESHRKKHMTNLIKASTKDSQYINADGTETKIEDEYTIVEVDPNDPRFNSDSLHSTDDPTNPYKNRVYTYQEIIDRFSNKTLVKV